MAEKRGHIAVGIGGGGSKHASGEERLKQMRRDLHE